MRSAEASGVVEAGRGVPRRVEASGVVETGRAVRMEGSEDVGHGVEGAFHGRICCHVASSEYVYRNAPVVYRTRVGGI